MAIELYGIRQNLGICEDIDGSVELPDIPNIDEKQYKKFKKINIKGGVEVFRGMADAKLLADISISIKNYQRDINDEHKEKLKKYLSDSNTDRIYFPEVTLLYKYDDTKNPEEISQSIIDLEDFKTTSNVKLLARLFETGVAVLTIEDGTRVER